MVGFGQPACDYSPLLWFLDQLSTAGLILLFLQVIPRGVRIFSKRAHFPGNVVILFLLIFYHVYRLNTCVSDDVVAYKSPSTIGRKFDVDKGRFMLTTTMPTENSHHPTPLCSSPAMQHGGCRHVEGYFGEPNLKFGCSQIEKMHRGKVLGEGYWRDVYETQYMGEKYVLKKMKTKHSRNSRNKERHRIEALVGADIGSHPNAVEVLGYCDTTVVTAWLPYKLDVILFEEKRVLDTLTMIKWALDIARGVAVFHSAIEGTVSHTDIQTRQFLLDYDGVVKINDYNRAKVSAVRPNGCPCGFETSKANGKWRAPEEYRFESLGQKLDIYSMSMVMWSLASNEKPFPDHDNPWVYEKVKEGVRPGIPGHVPPEFARLISECWHQEPDLRPSADQAVSRLEALYAKLTAEEEGGAEHSKVRAGPQGTESVAWQQQQPQQPAWNSRSVRQFTPREQYRGGDGGDDRLQQQEEQPQQEDDPSETNGLLMRAPPAPMKPLRVVAPFSSYHGDDDGGGAVGDSSSAPSSGEE